VSREVDSFYTLLLNILAVYICMPDFMEIYEQLL